MATRTLQFFLRELANGIKRNTLMMAASVSTVTILIFLSGLFLIFYANVRQIRAVVGSQIEIHAYLNRGLDRDQINQMRQSIASFPHVQSVDFVDKEEALASLRQDTKEDIDLSGIMHNPLPAYFSIRVNDPEYIAGVAASVEAIPGVDQVNYLQKIIQKFVALTRTIEHMIFGLVVLMLLATLSIIYNTIRLGVYSRKNEIEIMQLVGASRGLVCWPFILEGAFYGLIGAFAAIAFLKPGYEMAAGRISEILPVIPLIGKQQLWSLLYWLPVLGAGVGSSGSFLSVNRYIRY